MTVWQIVILIAGYAASVVFAFGAVNADTCAFYDWLDYVEFPSIRNRDWTAKHHRRLLAIGVGMCLVPVCNLFVVLIFSVFMRKGWSLSRRPRILWEAA